MSSGPTYPRSTARRVRIYSPSYKWHIHRIAQEERQQAIQVQVAPTSQANDSKSSDSNSNSSAVDTNNQPAKNSEGRVIEWITQYLRDGRVQSPAFYYAT